MVLVRPSPLMRIGELLRLLRTSKHAYERAYDKARRKDLRDLYGVLASSRITMIHELEDQCRVLGQAEEGARGMHRWDRIWKEVRDPSWFLGSDALLRTVHRGERRLLSAYDRNLLRADLPEPLVDLLRKQRVQLAENVGNIGLFLRNGLLLADH